MAQEIVEKLRCMAREQDLGYKCEKRKAMTLIMLESLAIHLEKYVPEIYAAMKAWFDKEILDFELPNEITNSSITTERVVSLLKPFAPPGLLFTLERKRRQARAPGRESKPKKVQKLYPDGKLP